MVPINYSHETYSLKVPAQSSRVIRVTLVEANCRVHVASSVAVSEEKPKQ